MEDRTPDTRIKSPVLYHLSYTDIWSDRRGLNPQHPAWKAGTLPVELLPQRNWWELWDLNPYAISASDPKSDVSAIPPNSHRFRAGGTNQPGIIMKEGRIMKKEVNTMVCCYAKVLMTVRRRKELLRQNMFRMLQAEATPSICTEIPLTRVVVSRYK